MSRQTKSQLSVALLDARNAEIDAKREVARLQRELHDLKKLVKRARVHVAEVSGAIEGKVPSVLSHFTQLRHYSFNFIGPAVYFLVSDDKVVYVGQTVEIHNRLATHRREKKFDSAFYLQVGRIEDLLEVEKAFIQLFKPKLNKSTRACAHQPVVILQKAGVTSTATRAVSHG